MKFAHMFAMAAAAIATAGAGGQTAPASAADHAAHHPSAVAAPQSDAEVRKIDKEQGKVTLRHGPLENLGMPAMTMVFKVSDAKMLDGLKEGDRVKFTAEKVNGAFSVTALQVVK